MKVDYKELSKSKGYISLRKAVLRNIEEERKRYIRWNHSPPEKFNPQGGRGNEHSKKFRWAIDRAKHYSHMTGLPMGEILDSWEKQRNYWYHNYYQDCNQPKLTGRQVLVVDTMEDIEDLGKDGFRCPACKGISTNPYNCNSGKSVTFSKTGICDWKSYGFFGTLGEGLFVFVKSKGRGDTIFFPVNI